MDGVRTGPRIWAFVLLAALTTTFGALALTLPGSGGRGTADAATSPLLTFHGAFSWRVTTVPSRVHHGRPMHFSVSVIAPYGPLPDYDMTMVDFGDGFGAASTSDFAGAGMPSCQTAYSPTSTTGPSSVQGSRPSGSSSAMSGPWPGHTYAKAGRYTVVVTYTNNCSPTQSETVRYAFGVS
jgi:hypothetical protein